jgi:hypothetical protein
MASAYLPMQKMETNMSLRFKSLSAAFAISLTMWAVMIQGGISIYQHAQAGSNGIELASLR